MIPAAVLYSTACCVAPLYGSVILLSNNEYSVPGLPSRPAIAIGRSEGIGMIKMVNVEVPWRSMQITRLTTVVSLIYSCRRRSPFSLADSYGSIQYFTVLLLV